MNRDRLLRVEERKHPASQHSVNSPSLTTLLTNNGNGSFAVCLYSCSIEKSKPGHEMNKAAAGRGEGSGLRDTIVRTSNQKTTASYKLDDAMTLNNVLRIRPTCWDAG
jgi:hypothetical protein